MAPLDNVSSFSRDFSNDLCSAITGGSVAARKLYQNFSLAQISYRACVLVNGIANPAKMKDLISRSLRVDLPAIESTHYDSLVRMDEEFAAAAGTIVAGCLDALARASAMPPPQMPWKSRLYDFMSWGYRLAEALGWSGPEFLAAYRSNVEGQRSESLTVFESMLVDWVREIGCWRGTVSNLLQDLALYARENGVDVRRGEIRWPQAPTVASALLAEAQSTLAEMGVRFTRLPRTKAGSRIELQMVAEQAAGLPTCRVDEEGPLADQYGEGDLGLMPDEAGGDESDRPAWEGEGRMADGFA
jgi:hypothetical protein